MSEIDAGNTVPKQRGRPFKKGQSGNPAGRAAGSRNRATLALEAIIEGQGEAVINALVQAALGGDTGAGRCLIDRLVPVRRERAVRFALPPLKTVEDAPAAMAAITAAVAEGELSPGEAADMSSLVERFTKVNEMTSIEARLQALEAKSGQKH